MFPNPANDKVRLIKPAEESAGALQVFDGSGRMYKQQTYDAASAEIWLDIQVLPAGHYLIRSGKGAVLSLIVLPDQNR